MQWDLDGKVVVVTGAGRGIGRAIAETFMRERAVVVPTDVTEDAVAWADEARRAAGLEGASSACDVRSTASVRQAVDAVLSRFGRIDVLVNNAGILGDGLIEDADAETWNRVFDVNVTGTFRTCQAVIPAMKRQGGGRIVNAASFAAIIPSVGGAAYAASKAAATMFTRCLGLELAPLGIRCNIVAPGSTLTPMQTGMWQDEHGAERVIVGSLETYKAGIPLRKLATPEDIAHSAMFLLSEQAGHVAMSDLYVDGGATLRG